jgi:hypothetical protein
MLRQPFYFSLDIFALQPAPELRWKAPKARAMLRRAGDLVGNGQNIKHVP